MLTPDGAIVSITADLSWTAGANATSHSVYFGTNPTPGAGEFQINQPGTTFDPDTMVAGTTYYWRIDEVGFGGTTTGEVWSFRAESLGTPTWECDNFILSFNSSTGKPSSFYYKPTSRHLLSGGNGFTAYGDGPDDQFERMYKLSDGRLLATNADYSRQVVCDVNDNHDKHIAFRIEEFIGVPTSSDVKLKFTLYTTTLDGQTRVNSMCSVYGDGVGIGLIGLDWITHCYPTFNAQFEYLWHRADVPSDPIGSFALFACAEPNLLDTVGEIEVAEGLPHPMFEGEWAKKNNFVARQSMIDLKFDGVAEKNEAIDYCKKGGFGLLYLGGNKMAHRQHGNAFDDAAVESAYKPAYKKLAKKAYFDGQPLSAIGSVESNQDSKTGDIDGFDKSLQMAKLETKKTGCQSLTPALKVMGDGGFEPTTR
ncbi:MAG: fibronectin type III domain-containing protein [Planctomycetes bacterium]|nr:fibronectin type III domain-containing protein [Planctomycetota bacterium]